MRLILQRTNGRNHICHITLGAYRIEQLHFSLSRLFSNVPAPTYVAHEFLTNSHLGIIHNLDSKGLPSRPNRPIALSSVRKETHRFAKDRQQRRDGFRTLAEFSQPQISSD